MNVEQHELLVGGLITKVDQTFCLHLQLFRNSGRLLWATVAFSIVINVLCEGSWNKFFNSFRVILKLFVEHPIVPKALPNSGGSFVLNYLVRCLVREYI